MQLSDYLQEKIKAVDKELQQIVQVKETPEKALYQAAHYSLMAGGKRLRPILAIATAESLGCKMEKILSPACALELIHTYSLIHDDLPCMDDDDLRRGKPTLHKVYPEAYAILAGDYLLTHSFEVISNAKELTDKQKIMMIQLLSEAAGAKGMIGGQVMDMEAEEKEVNLAHLKTIHQNKTGAMIKTSIAFGGVIAELNEGELEALKKYGEEIGLAFQIIDDILDVTQSSEVLGKTANSDLHNHKSTYVSLLGVKQAKAEAKAHMQKAQDYLKKLPLQSDLLDQLASYIINRAY